jgi:hypothetical protein
MEINSMEFARWCFDNGVRVAWMVPIASVGNEESISDPLDEWIEDHDREHLVKTFGSPFEDWMNKCGSDCDSLKEAFLEFVMQHRMTGFMVQVERQVRTYASQHKGVYSSGWGCFEPIMFYTACLDALFVLNVRAWSDKRLMKEKANPKKLSSFR